MTENCFNFSSSCWVPRTEGKSCTHSVSPAEKGLIVSFTYVYLSTEKQTHPIVTKRGDPLISLKSLQKMTSGHKQIKGIYWLNVFI